MRIPVLLDPSDIVHIKYMDLDFDQVRTVDITSPEQYQQIARSVFASDRISIDQLQEFYDITCKGRLLEVRTTRSGMLYSNPLDSMLLAKLSFNGYHIATTDINGTVRRWDYESVQDLRSKTLPNYFPTLEEILEGFDTETYHCLRIWDNDGNILYQCEEHECCQEYQHE